VQREECDFSETGSFHGHVGVKWAAHAKAWAVHIRCKPKEIRKYFPGKRYCEEEALWLAIAWREENANLAELVNTRYSEVLFNTIGK
jgi:AP2 domain